MVKRRASTKIACAAAALFVAAGASASAESASHYRGGLASCGTLSFRGPHKLVQRNLGCGQAKHHAMFVIKRLKAPPGWNCELTRVERGYASCSTGRKAFAVTPA